MCLVNRTHAHTFRPFRIFCLRVSERDLGLTMFRYKNIIISRYFTSNFPVVRSNVLVKANNVVCISVRVSEEVRASKEAV